MTPWDKRAAESGHQFAWFARFRDLGPTRTITKLATLDGAPSIKLLYSWSSLNGWSSRAEAWDADQDRQIRIEQTEAIKAMHRRHAGVATMIMQKAVERIRDLRPEQLSVSEALKMVELASKIEAGARGVQTAQTGDSVVPESGPSVLELLRKSPRLAELAQAVENELGAVYNDADS